MQKTILITGATSGFGKACAEVFGENGWKLILCGRRLERLEELRKTLSEKVPVHIASFDVRDREAAKQMVENLPEQFSDIDVLLNNAGLALGLNPSHQTDLDEWEIMVDTNIKGLMFMTRFVLPGMVERKKGHVVNLGSTAGNWPYPGGNTYGASKAFVKQFSHNLRCDVHGSGVRVTNIEPGLAETEFSVVRFNGDLEKAASVYDGTQPLTAADIAECVWWAVNQPSHVNINRIEVMPTCQSCAPLRIAKSTD